MSGASEKTDRELPVLDRRSGEVFSEKILGGSWMHLAYRSALHPLLKYTLFQSGLFSRVLGWYTRRNFSRTRIRPTIETLEIDETEFLEPVESFRTFHEFFVRRLKPELRRFDPNEGVFCSPADSRLSVLPELQGTSLIPVKGASFSLEALTRRENIGTFHGGCALIFRLCPSDYHRYHFPTDGRILEEWEISGRYDSVHPTALEMGIPVFAENRRIVSRLELRNFGPCLFIEVGAFGVGGIIQTHQERDFHKGDEKGYFQYGASSLILILERNRLQLDVDLPEISSTGLECLVRTGEKLGAVASPTP